MMRLKNGWYSGTKSLKRGFKCLQEAMKFASTGELKLPRTTRQHNQLIFPIQPSTQLILQAAITILVCLFT